MMFSRSLLGLFCLGLGGMVHLRADDVASSPVHVEFADSRFHGINVDPDFNLFFTGEKIVLNVHVDAGAPTGAAKFLSVEIKDAWVPVGEVAEPVFATVQPLATMPADLAIPADLKGRVGAWRVTCQLLDADKKALGSAGTTELAVVQPLDKPENPKDTYFGLCDVGKRGPAWNDYAHRALGVYHLRGGISWVDLEPAAKGQFNPNVGSVDPLLEAGFYPVLSTGYTPHWAMLPDRVNTTHPEWGNFSFGPPKKLDDFADYIRKAYSLVGPKWSDDVAWSLWNEPDEFFWQGSIDEFVGMMKVQYQTLKELNPKVQMVGFDPTGIGFVKQVCEHGGAPYFDVFGIHTYMSNTPEAAGLEDKIHSLRQLRDQYGPGRPMWDMEYNFKGDGEPSGPEAGQAYQMVRAHVLMLSQGITRFHWWTDNGNNLTELRTPTVAAYNQQTRMLDQTKFLEKIDLNDILTGYSRCYLFQRDNTVRTVLWRLGLPTSMAFDHTAGSRAFDFYGNALALDDGKASLTISPRPIYLTFPSSDLEAMRKNLQAAAITPVTDELKDRKLTKVEVEPLLKKLGDKPDLKFKIMILGGIAKGGTFKITNLPAGWKTDKTEAAFTLGDQTEGTYNVGQAAFVLEAAGRNENNNALFEDKEFSVSYEIKTDTGRIYQGQKLLTWQICTYTDKPPVIDGDLSDDWKEAMPTYMGEDVQERQKRWIPKDSYQWNGPDDLSANIFFMYDENYLYFGAKVRDDKQVQTGKSWEEDCIQLGIGDDFHPLIYLQGDTPKFEDLPPTTKLAIKRVGHITTYEMAIPLADYKFVKPMPGGEFGVDIVLDDEDGDGRGRHIIEYCEGIANGKDTNKFKKWVFLK